MTGPDPLPSPSGSSGPGPRRARRLAWTALVGVAALACGGDHEFEPPDRAARVAAAESAFARMSFDTVTWASDSARALAGSELYAAECRKCHGYLGRGDTDYARQRELDVPSLVGADAAHAGDVDSVRHRIYVGHQSGMPSWGVGRLTVRQIDAAAYYVVHQLRPEVSDGGE